METNEHGSMDLSAEDNSRHGAVDLHEHGEEGRNEHGMVIPKPIGAPRKREAKERSERESRLRAEREREREWASGLERERDWERLGERESERGDEEERGREQGRDSERRADEEPDWERRADEERGEKRVWDQRTDEGRNWERGANEGRDWERGTNEERGDENRVWRQRTEGDRGQERRREIDEERGRGKQRGRERANERAERHGGHAEHGRREEDAKAEPGSFSAGGDGEVKPEDRIPDRIDEWLEKLKKESGLDTSFDVQVRQMTFGHKRTGILFLSPFAKDTALTEILKRLSQLDPESFRHGSSALKTFFEFYLPAIQVTVTRSMSKLIEEVMIGNTAFYVDGESAALIIDAKQYPARTPDEPVLEKVVRGSKDGFTETLLTNVALIRRRLRDPHLRFEILKVGTRTQTDVAIGYVEDIADAKLVEALRDKIQAVNIDGIPLGDKQLEEMTVKTDWNPFPLVRYSERPDVVASHLMNGSVTVVVDTSPSVILLPTTFFDLVQHAEENRQNAFIGTYLRWVRFFGILSSIFLLPLWFLFAENPELRPHWLWFLGADKTGDLPLILQFLMVEIGVDLMRLAAVHTPSPLVTAMSLVSAILVGDIAVKTGLFINEVILYMAVAAIGMFATPSYELGLANRIVRLVLLLAAFAFQAPGLVVAATVIFIWLALTRSFNSPYLWPLIPFNAGAMLAILLRRPLPKNRYRPSINRPKQNRKQPFGHRGGEAGAGS